MLFVKKKKKKEKKKKKGKRKINYRSFRETAYNPSKSGKKGEENLITPKRARPK